jgi:hypothetical protein
MKTTAKTMAILIALFFSTLTLVGQKSLLFQDVQSPIAAAPVTNFDVKLSAENKLISSRFFMEDKLQLEDWMLSSEKWKLAESETGITLEEWMVETHNDRDTSLEELIMEEVETPLKLEKWMYCCTDWKIVNL